MEAEVQGSVGLLKDDGFEVGVLEGLSVFEMIDESSRSGEQDVDALPQPVLLVVGLLASDQ